MTNTVWLDGKASTTSFITCAAFHLINLSISSVCRHHAGCVNPARTWTICIPAWHHTKPEPPSHTSSTCTKRNIDDCCFCIVPPLLPLPTPIVLRHVCQFELALPCPALPCPARIRHSVPCSTADEEGVSYPALSHKACILKQMIAIALYKMLMAAAGVL